MGLRRWLTLTTQKFAAASLRPDARAKADALDALGREGCPVCRAVKAAVDRWFFAYENDTRADPAMRERLERSGGFCAAHTRHLLDMGASASWLARWVFADVARAAVRGIAGDAPCPACEVGGQAASDAVGSVAVGLVDPEVRQMLDAGDGLCLTHGLAVIERGGAVVGRAVAAVMESRLGKDSITARDQLISADVDMPRRRRMREERAGEVLAAEAALRSGRPLGEVDIVLGWSCCPLCGAADLAEWRCLRWLSGTDGSGDGRRDAPSGRGANGEHRRTDTVLCTRHLGDLVNVRYQGAPVGLELTDAGLLVPVAAAIESVASAWRSALQTYLHRLDSGTQAARAYQSLARGLACQVCDARKGATARRIRLLGLIAADPAFDSRIVQAHGVCLRHAGADQPVGQRTQGRSRTLAPTWHRLLQARIGLLSYELDESERKSSWGARWELRGTEMTAWQRAPYLLDGAILGPLAPTEPLAPVERP